MNAYARWRLEQRRAQLRREMLDTPSNDPDCAGLCARLEAELTAVQSALRDRPSNGVLRVSEAVMRLPMRDSDARAWLRREGLVGDLDGREVVVWSDVLDRLRVAPPKERPERPRKARKPKTQRPAPSLPSAGLWEKLGGSTGRTE